MALTTGSSTEEKAGASSLGWLGRPNYSISGFLASAKQAALVLQAQGYGGDSLVLCWPYTTGHQRGEGAPGGSVPRVTSHPGSRKGSMAVQDSAAP